MTLEEIYAIPMNGNGWRVLPVGKNVKFGIRITWPGNNIDASVGDYARIGKSPLYIQGTKPAACISAPDIISIGCQTHAFSHWQEHVITIALENGYIREEAREYKAIVDFMIVNGKD